MCRQRTARRDHRMVSKCTWYHQDSVFHDLGFHQGSVLSMKHHVAKVTAICHYHLRSDWMCQEVATRLANAFYGDLKTGTQHWPVNLRQLLHHLNMFRTQRLASSSIRQSMHWLPVHWHVQFKLLGHALCPLCDMSSISDEHCRAHWCQLDVFQPSFDIVNGLHTAILLWLRTKFGERMFSYARPCMERTAWRPVHHSRPCRVQKTVENTFFLSF